MSYALGLVLRDDAVCVECLDAAPTDPPVVEEHPPVLFCEAGRTWAGRDAIEHGAGREQGFVDDVVAGFTVDRVFLTAGRLLTPDQALRELIWGVASRVARRRQEWAAAVTVSCPSAWSAPGQARVESIVRALGLRQPRVVAGFDAAAAAHDAHERLPREAAVPTAEEVPDLVSRIQRERVRPPTAPAFVPERTQARSSSTPFVASLVAVICLLAIVVVLLLVNPR